MYLTTLSIANLIPESIMLKTNIANLSVINFMKFASNKIKSSDKILDAGAGSCPYKKYFSHTKYESTDFENIFEKSFKNKHTFICSLENIPKSNDSYNAIICTEVLEHVEYPSKVIKEFYRILKPQGKLFLSAPQSWGLHGEPHHYFNFTKYGLISLFNNAGFRIVFIKPKGGLFWYLGFVVKNLPDNIFSQYLKKPLYLKIFLFFIYLLSLPFCVYLFPLMCYYLDGLDKNKHFTLGHTCYCIKSKRKI